MIVSLLKENKISVLAFFGVMLCGIMLASNKALADRAVDAGLQPHKALYDISLVSTHGGVQIVNISGQMFYDWQPSCDAWISNHRFTLLYEYADSPAVRMTSDFSTFETMTGAVMDFVSQRKRDGNLYEEIRGQATRDGQNGGEAQYNIPKDLVFDLPEGTVFPMDHTLGLLDAMKAGKKFYKTVIFDGSDQDGPIEVNAFIGKEAHPMAALEGTPNLDTSILNVPAKNVRLAFFPLNDPTQTADYEMSIVFHENGVISDMIIEYEDFTISQKLVALERLGGDCEETDNAE